MHTRNRIQPVVVRAHVCTLRGARAYLVFFLFTSCRVPCTPKCTNILLYSVTVSISFYSPFVGLLCWIVVVVVVALDVGLLNERRLDALHFQKPLSMLWCVVFGIDPLRDPQHVRLITAGPLSAVTHINALVRSIYLYTACRF